MNSDGRHHRKQEVTEGRKRLESDERPTFRDVCLRDRTCLKKFTLVKTFCKKCLKERRDRAEYTGTLLECGGGCQVTPSWLVWNEKMPTSACIFQR